MGTATSIAPGHEVDLETERAALARARTAVDAKLDRIRGIAGGGADEASDEYIDAVVSRHDRQAAARPRRVRTHRRRPAVARRPLRHRRRAASSWSSTGGPRSPRSSTKPASTDPLGLDRRVSYVGCIDDLMVEDFATGERLRHVAADGRAVPQPWHGDARGGRDAADRAGPARAPRPRRAASCSGADRARARRSSACTARRGSSTTTAASRPTASSCSARATGSCASSSAVLPTLGEARIHQTTLRPPARPVRAHRATTSAGSTCSTGSRPICTGPPR